MHRKTGRSGETKVALPALITAVTPQRKNPDRFSLFHKEEFITGVSSATLLHFNLAKGVEITRDLLDRIHREEERIRIRETFLRLLGRRDHARDELKLKALRRGFSSDVAESILDELEQKNYLDDGKFAWKYACDQLRIRKWGPRKIALELQKKGVSRDRIDRVLSKLADSLELKEICVDLACKRRAHFSRERDPVRRRQKIAAYLQGKGFAYESINEALPDILDQLNVQKHNS